MSSTPEGKVKAKITAKLKSHGAYYYMPVPSASFGKPSLDYVGCHNGLFYGIEAKAGTKTYTSRQRLTASDMEAAGGKVFLVNEDPLTLLELETWLACTAAK